MTKESIADLRTDGREALEMVLRVLRELSAGGVVSEAHAIHARKCIMRTGRIIAGNFMGRCR